MVIATVLGLVDFAVAVFLLCVALLALIATINFAVEYLPTANKTSQLIPVLFKIAMGMFACIAGITGAFIMFHYSITN